jgi:hypothetical protein
MERPNVSDCSKGSKLVGLTNWLVVLTVVLVALTGVLLWLTIVFVKAEAGH